MLSGAGDIINEAQAVATSPNDPSMTQHNKFFPDFVVYQCDPCS